MNRHAVDTVSLVSVLVFAAIVGWWLLLQLATVTAPGPGWIAAAALLAAGAAGTATTIASVRNRRAVDAGRDQVHRSTGS